MAVSRAVAPLNILSEYMLPFNTVNGISIFMKGPNCIGEIKENKRAIEVLGGKIDKIEEIILPDSDIKRTIIKVNKIANTPKEYPRRQNIIKNKSL